MMEYKPMSDSEAEVMQLLWDAGEAMTSARIIQLLQQQNKSWKPSTVWTFLGRLVEKGLLQAEKVGKRSYYTPILTEAEYRRAQTRQFLQTVHGGSVKSFFAALSGGEEMEGAELDELRAWLRGEGGESES